MSETVRQWVVVFGGAPIIIGPFPDTTAAAAWAEAWCKHQEFHPAFAVSPLDSPQSLLAGVSA